MDAWEIIEKIIEEAPEGTKATADLYNWSTNFDTGKGPFTLFLDIIGWSEDELGMNLYNMAEASLGYMELGKLGDSLSEYADRPTEVRELVDALLAAEMGDDEDSAGAL